MTREQTPPQIPEGREDLAEKIQKRLFLKFIPAGDTWQLCKPICFGYKKDELLDAVNCYLRHAVRNNTLTPEQQREITAICKE